jgi:AcrR family transcriptional regulator
MSDDGAAAGAAGDPPADEFASGNGTPEGRRALQLLWDPPEPAARGPRPKFRLDEVVQAGVALADADGLAALSMRRVASRLGAGAMSLYTYVPGRSELVELMVDAVYADHDPVPDGLSWRERIELLAREHWRRLARHPWLLDLNVARMPLGPHVLDVEEAMYAACAATGLRGADVVALSNLVSWQVVGAARSALADVQEERQTGTSAEAYWLSRASFWSTYFDYARYPTMTEIWSAGGFDDDRGHSFDVIIRRLLDAVEVLLERAGPGDSPEDPPGG